MSVRTDEGRSVAFDLKNYDRIDHGYAATIHKAQGMTVDRTHVLVTPGMDAHGSYVALSRHRDGTDLNYGRDDFANQDRLARTLSRDRAKDMATDYEPTQAYAERRGITFRERVAEIVKKIVPEKVRAMFDGRHSTAETAPGDNAMPQPGRDSAGIAAQRNADAPDRRAAEDLEEALRGARKRALVRHARASDAIIEAKQQGLAPSAEQRRELGAARRAFDEVRPHGWQDAEAAYSKDNSLAREVGSGRIGRAIRALQLETEIRTGRDVGFGADPARRADRFVERWRKLDQTSQRQYQAGDMAAYKSTRAQMGDMAKSLERDPQNGIPARQPKARTRHRRRLRLRPQPWPGARLYPRSRPRQGTRHRHLNPSYVPPLLRHGHTLRFCVLRGTERLSCLVSAAIRNSQQEAPQPCANQIVSSE